MQQQMQYDFDKKEDSLKQKQIITATKLQVQKKQKVFLLGWPFHAWVAFYFCVSEFPQPKEIKQTGK